MILTQFLTTLLRRMRSILLLILFQLVWVALAEVEEGGGGVPEEIGGGSHERYCSSYL